MCLFGLCSRNSPAHFGRGDGCGMRARTQTYKDARFFLLAATITILVSGADGFAQDSFTGARSFSWLPRTHLSAKAAAQSSRSTSSPTRDAQAVSLANLPVVTDFDVDTVAASSLPSAPEPKVRPEAEPVTLRSAAQPFLPVRPATRPRETPKQRKIWYGLMVVSHSGATFDGWTTRRAVANGYGKEANPFLRPFANSNAIYAATQASPAFMDFLGKRMMVSQSPWIRKLWWLPQVAGASLSFTAGVRNIGVVH